MSEPTSRYGPGFWVAVVAGSLIVGWGIVGYLDAVTDTTRRIDLAVWLIGSDLIHDLIVAPLVIGAGWLLAGGAAVGPRPVQAAAILSAVVLVLAWLPLHHTAEAARNPTIQPLDYSTATFTALGLVWLGCAGWAAWRALRADATPT